MLLGDKNPVFTRRKTVVTVFESNEPKLNVPLFALTITVQNIKPRPVQGNRLNMPELLVSFPT